MLDKPSNNNNQNENLNNSLKQQKMSCEERYSKMVCVLVLTIQNRAFDGRENLYVSPHAVLNLSVYLKNHKLMSRRYAAESFSITKRHTLKLFQSIVSSKALGQLLSLPKGNKPVRSTIKNCEHPNPRNLFPLRRLLFCWQPLRV
jgi:hypothetical protein